MPGPIAACAMSTGAIVAFCISANALFNVVFNSRKNSPFPQCLFSGERFRHASTIDDAKAFDSWERIRLFISVRIGKVAVI